MTMEINFTGKKALVTGAGKGIGRFIVKALVQCGAEVIALSRTQADLESLKKEIPSVKPLCVDLCNIEDAMKAIEEQGDIHLVVNNAGIMSHESILEVKPEDFDKTMSINVKAALFVTQAVARKMVSRGYAGSIVNISSICSFRALAPATYCCSKAALDMLTKVMALELGPHKIRVNSVNPGVVFGTNITCDDVLKALKKEIDGMVNATPLGKTPDMQDVSNAILFLLSDKAAMINGVSLLVEGGLFVH